MKQKVEFGEETKHVQRDFTELSSTRAINTYTCRNRQLFRKYSIYVQFYNTWCTILNLYSYSPAGVVPRLCVLLFLYTCVQYIHSNERDFQKLVKAKSFVYVFSCIYKISCMYVYTRYTIHDTRYRRVSCIHGHISGVHLIVK